MQGETLAERGRDTLAKRGRETLAERGRETLAVGGKGTLAESERLAERERERDCQSLALPAPRSPSLLTEHNEVAYVDGLRMCF